jgi:hypothetical protein
MKRTLTTALVTTATALSLYLVAPQPAGAQPPPPAVRGGGPRNDGVIRNAPGQPPHYHVSRSRNSNDWGFGFRFGPTFVVPRRVVVSPSTTYVTPATPQENFLPTPSVDPPGVVLLNPTRNSGPVNYTLNDVRCTMAAGYQQKLPGEREWIIEFDRGGSFGTARYSLTPGAYAFAVTERGWEVFRRTDPVAAEAPVPAPAAPEVAQASP